MLAGFLATCMTALIIGAMPGELVPALKAVILLADRSMHRGDERGVRRARCRSVVRHDESNSIFGYVGQSAEAPQPPLFLLSIAVAFGSAPTWRRIFGSAATERPFKMRFSKMDELCRQMMDFHNGNLGLPFIREMA